MANLEGVTHRFIDTNGIKMHIAEQGTGPAVLLLHGFPSIWYLWRRQMKALADAGYHAIAPDQRGYGQTGGPDAEDQYTILHMVGDLIGLLDALGEKEPVLVVGHDWGSIIGWYLCYLRPDRVKGYIGVSVPAFNRPPGEVDWIKLWESSLGEGFYMCRFQEPGRAERDFASVGTEAVLKAFTCAFWDSRMGGVNDFIPAKDKELSTVFYRGELPTWYSEEDLKYCTEQFDKCGFTGALNGYRNAARSFKLLAAWVGAKTPTKAYYITGDKCGVNEYPGILELTNGPVFKEFVPNLREVVFIKDAAHFVMEEQPEAFNEKMLTFLADLQK